MRMKTYFFPFRSFLFCLRHSSFLLLFLFFFSSLKINGKQNVSVTKISRRHKMIFYFFVLHSVDSKFMCFLHETKRKTKKTKIKDNNIVMLTVTMSMCTDAAFFFVFNSSNEHFIFIQTFLSVVKLFTGK